MRHVDGFELNQQRGYPAVFDLAVFDLAAATEIGVGAGH
jgi:hypothetical protein